MKILVCVKSVPDPATTFRINAAGTGYEESGVVFGVNEYDWYAMEEAVRIKERFQDVELTALTVGPQRAEAALRKAMTLGADQGLRIDDADQPAGDALAVASLIAAYARDRNYDLIFCGVMSQDLQRGQTGPMLAQLLRLPAATTVVDLKLAEDQKSLACERELEGGRRERIALTLPALLTVQSGLNTPRYASLTNVLRVKQLDIPAIPAAFLAPVRKGEDLLRAFLPERSAACEFLEGDVDWIAEQLIAKVRQRVPVW
jgi:electron transfer flavoprotein beta subunit